MTEHDAITLETQDDSEKIEGTVVRIRYSNPETLFTIAVLKTTDNDEVAIVGNLAGLLPHEDVIASGTWKNDKKYGLQFLVDTFEKVLPTDLDAIEGYLASGLIKGIGAVYAKRLIAKFGTEIFNIIESEPRKLLEVDGIGKSRYKQIIDGWNEHRALRLIIMFLQKHDISPSFASKIYRQYGNETIKQLERNPYQLAMDIWGIGFTKADNIAMKLGIPVESIERVKAGIHYILQEDSGSGNCFCTADNLITQATTILGVEQELVINGINKLNEERHIVLDVLPDGTRAVYLEKLYKSETSVANRLKQILSTAKHLPTIEFEKSCTAFETNSSLALAPNQKQAVEAAVKGGVMVITGGPGTGKTTIIRAIISIFDAHNISYTLAAPTGRAAKRIQETTGKFSMTLHRLLQFMPGQGGWQVNSTNPIKSDVVIVDEASMIDIALADALIKAIKPHNSLIFVGDSDQLPSVGPGNFLHDIMDNKVIPVVRLNEIFRQARNSLIVMNAHKINHGEFPIIPQKVEGEIPKADFLFVEAFEPEIALGHIKKLVSKTLPALFKYDPMEDIQVLSPTHKTLIGCKVLNRELQQVLNPKGLTMEYGGSSYRVGDKVMQTENNYDKNVFNGDIGRIQNIDVANKELTVEFDRNLITYNSTELDQLDLAYAITVHKSQGSEYKCVVIPIMTTTYIMLQRNLIYTAITRGKKHVIIVGQKNAIRMAIENVPVKPRLSALNQRISMKP